MNPFLFSYGTLQLDKVQLATYGRLLEGKRDTLLGYTIKQIYINDPQVRALSQKDFHPILVKSDNPLEAVEGTIYRLTQEEILKTDTYEVADYKRIELEFASGNKAWVYIGK